MKLIYGLILYNIIQYLIHTYSPTGLAIWKPDEVAKRDDTLDIETLIVKTNDRYMHGPDGEEIYPISPR